MMILDKMLKPLQDAVQYFTEAFVRVFGPSDDEYPAVGVQPFEGDVIVNGEE